MTLIILAVIVCTLRKCWNALAEGNKITHNKLMTNKAIFAAFAWTLWMITHTPTDCVQAKYTWLIAHWSASEYGKMMT